MIAWNPATNEVRSGQIDAAAGLRALAAEVRRRLRNRDKELDDPKGYGAIEYAYSIMAKAAGIEMSECRLLEEHGRRHFMTRRFDRTRDGDKLHMQSLGALAHFDFNQPGAYAYEQALLVDPPARAADGRDRGAVPAHGLQRRRAQPGRPRQEHRLPDGPAGAWSLAPAFDVTYGYNPTAPGPRGTR